MNNTIFLLTITDVEYNEAKKHFLQDDEHKHDDLVFEIGTLCDRPCILFKCPEMGARAKGSVSQYLHRALDITKPAMLIELGIAFSLKNDLNIGDVCISRMAEDYEYQKVNLGEIQHRGRQADADISAVNRLRNCPVLT